MPEAYPTRYSFADILKGKCTRTDTTCYMRPCNACVHRAMYFHAARPFTLLGMRNPIKPKERLPPEVIRHLEICQQQIEQMIEDCTWPWPNIKNNHSMLK